MLTNKGDLQRSARVRRRAAAWLVVAILILPPLAVSLPRHSQEKKVRTPEQTSKPAPQPESAPGQEDVVTLRADLVVVNVTVTDTAGQYAHGLKQADFALLEDDSPQTISSFSAEESPFAAALLIDMSGS